MNERDAASASAHAAPFASASRARRARGARRSSTAWVAVSFCAFALYIGWHASHGDASRPIDEMPLPAARGESAGATYDDGVDRAEVVKRGQYLARLGDCIGCHTADTRHPLAGGRALETPFGKIYTPNITPDPETGIGQWSDADFVRAMHEGIGKRGERLYPAFPYVEFTRLTEADVLAIRAYLDTVAPVRYRPPPNELRFPFNQRWLMIVWNLFNFDEGRFVPDPRKSPEYNRGAYLVLGIARCEECHTPRNFMQGLRERERFSGATQAGWRAYNITSDPKSGIGGWSDEALAAYLRTGNATGHARAAGPMADVVRNSTHYLTDEDLRSVVIYLRARQPVAGGVTRSRDAKDEAAAGMTKVRGAAVARSNGATIVSRETGRAASVVSSAVTTAVTTAVTKAATKAATKAVTTAATTARADIVH